MKKDIIFNQLGFPITLMDCPVKIIDGEVVPDINYKNLEEAVFDALPFKMSKLKGAELKFIRLHLEMTQKKFAAWLEDPVDESLISKWEKSDLEETNMTSSMERSLRIQLIGLINEKKRRKNINLKEMTSSLTKALNCQKREAIFSLHGVTFAHVVKKTKMKQMVSC